MTQTLTVPSFKNIALGFAGLALALCCFFAAAPMAHANACVADANGAFALNSGCVYPSGLNENQVSALLSLLSAFGTSQSVINNVAGIVRGQSQSQSSVYFSASPTSGQAPLAVSFSASNAVSGTQYTAEFGDGTSGSMNAPAGNGNCTGSSSNCVLYGAHTYASSGTYIAKLMANPTNGGFPAQIGTVTIRVGAGAPVAAPQASIAPDNSAIAIGQSTMVRVKYAPGTGDSITCTDITNTADGSSGLVGPCVPFNKSYRFTGTSEGTATFYAAAQTQALPAWRTYGNTTVRVVAGPGATITASSATVPVGGSVIIHADYNASPGDKLVCTDLTNTADGSSGLVGPCLPFNKSYTFTPTGTGTVTFYAAAQSQFYPAWKTYDSVKVTVISRESAIAPTCPPLHKGVTSISARNGQGSCSVSTTTGEATSNAQGALTAALPLSADSSGAPDMAGLLAAAVMAPWQAAVDSFSKILYAVGAY